ncbi:TVP38/TMEM64 family protein [Streptococcus ovis]|uniref:TVP38/TMEM64 family protein n=1 Tax=Streptococcus ovis TaxID=82806 RepID=UPI00035DA13A|nr:TVP38/TMEM64 family protein [Streptococcus ovis]
MYKFWQKTIQVLSVLVIIATFFILIWLYKIGILNDQNVLKEFLEQQGHYGSLTYIAIQIIQVVFPIIPGGVTTVVGFLVFGPMWGFLVNYVGIIIGSVILFWLSRTFGKKFCLLFMKEETFYKYESKIDDKKSYEIFFILCMLSPISPADVLVMITGLTSMSYKKFMTIILLCKPLSIIAYSYFWIYGSQLLQHLFNK